MQDFEKLGAFYLGRRHDVESGETTDETLLYDAKDLITHAVCVGMTGSGKTGLCISLLEEAAIDGIPAIVIDPKGDMGNLMLGFPNLAAEDFAPWVDPAEAVREGEDPAAYARTVAARWKQGLAGWGQDGARIRKLQDAADVAIYTPKSSAGIPLTVLRSFDAPPAAVAEDAEAFAERIQSATAGLLGLLGIEADPIQSRETILISNILQHAWRSGRSVKIADLVRSIQAPPFERLGVLELDSFYPAKDRAQLAMALNGLLASPSFAQWMEGEPLEIPKLLFGAQGKPRVAILSIAHLSESERMFFVTLLLNEVVAWMRTQSGTSSLRALLYMDEIFGYFPPTAQPPSKRPMLTLLKQARAYGLGVVLATQNPVDLDYKGLSNTGTWFIGRLQTERDKARVLDGLEGAMAEKGFDRAELDRVLSGLGKRVFLMNNVHDDAPVLFHTRWAMSYLRGPLSRDHIRQLMAPAKDVGRTVAPDSSPSTEAAATPAPTPVREVSRPVLPSGVREFFVPRVVDREGRLTYRPVLDASVRLHYVNASAGIDFWSDLWVRASFTSNDGVAWDAATYSEELRDADYASKPDEAGHFSALPLPAMKAKSYTTWQKGLESHVYRTRPLRLWKNKKVKLMSKVGETEPEFRARVLLAAREKRDLAIGKLRKRYAPKLARVQERIRKAEVRVDREQEQVKEKRTSSLISMGSTLLGALFGRKLASAGNVRRAGSAMRSVGRVSKEKADVQRALREVEAQQAKLAELEAEFEEELAERQTELHADELELEERIIRPRKADIEATKPVLVWTPWWVTSSGEATRAFE